MTFTDDAIKLQYVRFLYPVYIKISGAFSGNTLYLLLIYQSNIDKGNKYNYPMPLFNAFKE